MLRSQKIFSVTEKKTQQILGTQQYFHVTVLEQDLAQLSPTLPCSSKIETFGC